MKITKKQTDKTSAGELRKIVKSLNGAKVLEDKIKVGKKSLKDLLAEFTTAIEGLSEEAQGKLQEECADVVLFYNKIWEEDEPEDKKSKGKGKKEGKGKKKKSVSKRPKTFDDLKKSLKDPKGGAQIFDSLCIKGGKVETLIKKLHDQIDGYNALKTKSQVAGHVAYREKRGYVYEKTESGVIKLVDFEAK